MKRLKLWPLSQPFGFFLEGRPVGNHPIRPCPGAPPSNPGKPTRWGAGA